MNCLKTLCLILATVASLAASASAKTGCTLVQLVGEDAPFFRNGDKCDQAFAPASTFKLVLSLIGFEEGILHSPYEPSVNYNPTLNAPYESWRQATTPRKWLRYSVIWYSHWLTRQIGIAELQKHVDAVGYGNRDLTGTPGKDDGLTRAWLSTSLKITPVQQAQFLQRLVLGQLQFSEAAIEKTLAAAQSFDATDRIQIKGKTGNAWATDTFGNRLAEQHGWFVGWFEYQGEKYTFVHLIVQEWPSRGFASSRARQQVLKSLPKWLNAR